MISILLPSRGRPAQLHRSIKSLCQFSLPEVKKIEILTRFDEDDPSLEDSMRVAKASQCWTFVGPRHGYAGLHHYYNELAEKADGDWLFLWNDDAFMQTYRWEDQFGYEYLRDTILSPMVNEQLPGSCLFPVVPRSMYEAVGHFSLNRHCDTWWEQIGRTLGMIRDVDIQIFHDRSELDATHNEREYDPEFFSDGVQLLLQADAAKIKEEYECRIRRTG